MRRCQRGEATQTFALMSWDVKRWSSMEKCRLKTSEAWCGNVGVGCCTSCTLRCTKWNTCLEEQVASRRNPRENGCYCDESEIGAGVRVAESMIHGEVWEKHHLSPWWLVLKEQFPCVIVHSPPCVTLWTQSPFFLMKTEWWVSECASCACKWIRNTMVKRKCQAHIQRYATSEQHN